VPRSSSPFAFTLLEVEPEKRYVLKQRGQKWEQDFTTVASAYFFARSKSDDGQGQMVVVNHAGERSTLYLF